MTYLYVLFDEDCALCRRARSWLAKQPQLVPLRFIAAGSEETRQLFPELDPASILKTLTVIGDHGEIYRGAKAWVMCLWALREHREMALGLTSPELMPVARRFVAWVSEHRHDLSRVVS